MNTEYELKTEYLTYNGFNRPALFRGIPLIPFIVGLILLLVTFFIGVLAFGFYGLILPSLIIAALFSIKKMCADDPNAMVLKSLQFKGLVQKGFRTANILKVE